MSSTATRRRPGWRVVRYRSSSSTAAATGFVGILQHGDLVGMEQQGQRAQRDHAGCGLVPRDQQEQNQHHQLVPVQPASGQPFGGELGQQAVMDRSR
ncbi:hypothetical protein ABT167_36990 [Streptomyces sp. NPDC001792]|uniref:hypothetical protein n=1 Tax=Streptomyces sp. NPDC001792 TaxID=3154524 RepID=UPI00331A69C6